MNAADDALNMISVNAPFLQIFLLGQNWEDG
jgi:hypothetical protein